MVVEKDADGSVFLKLDVPERSLNVFTREVLADLDAALDRIAGGEKPAHRGRPQRQVLGLRGRGRLARLPQDPDRGRGRGDLRPGPGGLRQAGGAADADPGGDRRAVPGRRAGAGPGLRLSAGLRQALDAARLAGGASSACCPAGAARSGCMRVVGLERAPAVDPERQAAHRPARPCAAAWPMPWPRPRRVCASSSAPW